MLNVLFVCSRNRLRSPTAQVLFSRRAGLRTMSAGLNKDSDTPVTGDLIEWADLICVMEAAHHRRLVSRFGRLLRSKRIAVLGIPDDFEFMDPELIQLLEHRVAQHIR